MHDLPFLLPYLVSMLISAGVAFYAWRHRFVAGATAFTLYAFGQMLWTFGYIFELAVPGLVGKLFWDNFQYIGGFLSASAGLIFVLQYTRKNINSQRYWQILGAIGFCLTLVAFTDGRYMGGFHIDPYLERHEPFDALYYDFAPLGAIAIFYMFGLIFATYIVLLNALRKTHDIYRQQIAILLVGFVIPVAGTLLSFSGMLNTAQRDITPLMFAVSDVVILWGLFRYRLLDIVPIAQETLIENMDAALITLDLENRIVEFNPHAQEILIAGKIGQSIETCFPEWVTIQSDEYRKTTEIMRDGRYYEATLTHLYDRQRVLVGRMLMVRNVTERVLANQALQAAQAETNILYQIGSAINAAQTHTEILDAIAKEMRWQDVSIALNIFENYQRENASYVETIALFAVGTTHATVANMRYPYRPIAQTEPGLVVVENVERFERLTQEQKVVLLTHNTRALLSADFTLGLQQIGTLTFACAQPRAFSQQERRLVRAIADLVAAAVMRIRLYQEQVEVAEKLRAVDQLKSQFLASMSHELRTPLNAILNFSEFMALGMLGDVTERQKDALGKILSSGKHLLSLINDVLDITKIESGMMNLFIEEHINLTPEINAAIAATETILKDKPVVLVKDIDADLPLLVADKRRLRQVLLNLLSNAAKFTEEGSITLAVKKQGANLLLLVGDTGPGIAPDEQALIFEPFVQTDTGIKHAGGTGLGLPITKKLVEAHGGNLWLESAVGEGTTFFITLPVRSQALLDLIQLPEGVH